MNPLTTLLVAMLMMACVIPASTTTNAGCAYETHGRECLNLTNLTNLFTDSTDSSDSTLTRSPSILNTPIRPKPTQLTPSRRGRLGRTRGYIRIIEDGRIETDILETDDTDKTVKDVACSLCIASPSPSPNFGNPNLNESVSAQDDQDPHDPHDPHDPQDDQLTRLFRLVSILLIRVLQNPPPQRLRG